MYIPEYTPDTVGEVLRELSVEEATIREIVGILERGADDIGSFRLRSVNPQKFGGSQRGENLGRHTEIAHRHVLEAMDQMVSGLRGYQENVHRFNDELVFTDQDGDDRARRTTARVQAAPFVVVEQDDRSTTSRRES